MPALRNVRRSRRLSRRSPVEAADYDYWEGPGSPQLLYPSSEFEVDISSRLNPPSPSTCTTTSADTPDASPLTTHLPFTPGSSHSRNRKAGHIPRPPNAFMVFRSWLWNQDNLKSVEKDNRNVSRIAGRYWNELSEAERAPYRRLAEEAKARHAELYPDYKYSPTSRAKPKAPQRRFKRSCDDEKAHCQKVADLLMEGITGNDLVKFLDEEEEEQKGSLESGAKPVEAPTSITRAPTPAPRATSRRPNKKAGASQKKLSSRRSRSLRKPPFHPMPAAGPSSTPNTEVVSIKIETAETPALFASPELAYPADCMEAFVPTEDIPYISLDDCDETVRDACLLADDPSTEEEDVRILPAHMIPGTHSPFGGVKPEAVQFVDSCILGAINADSHAPPTPPLVPIEESHSFFESEYMSCDLYSPVVFSNPFETTYTERSPTLVALDQLFAPTISPLSPAPSFADGW